MFIGPGDRAGKFTVNISGGTPGNLVKWDSGNGLTDALTSESDVGLGGGLSFLVPAIARVTAAQVKQLRLSYDASFFTDFGTQSAGGLVIAPNVSTFAGGGGIFLSADVAVAGVGGVQITNGQLDMNTHKVVNLTQATATTDAVAGGRSIATSTGLSGGGNLTADRTLTVDQSFSPTWTGTHTFSLKSIHSAGIEVGASGTDGRFDSNRSDSASAIAFQFKPTTAFTTTAADRSILLVEDSAGTDLLNVTPVGAVAVNASADATIIFNVSRNTNMTGANLGLNFNAALNGAGTTVGSTTSSTLTTCCAAANYNISALSTNASNTNSVGAAFIHSFASSTQARTHIYGAVFQATQSAAAGSAAGTITNMGGWRSRSMLNTMGTLTNIMPITNWYGGYVERSLVTGATQPIPTNSYGLYLEEQTFGGTIKNGAFFEVATNADYKAIVMRDQDVSLGSSAAGTMDLRGTFFNILFYEDAEVSYEDDMVVY